MWASRPRLGPPSFPKPRVVGRGGHRWRPRVETELGSGWVTTPEQPLLDLVDRPTLGGLDRTDARDAVRSLAAVADLDLALHLADTQHKRRAHGIISAASSGGSWSEIMDTG